ncbi:cellulose synthase catalytic subunit (UDP-forming) (plasmid) [Alloyangia pacifica]|uniref:Cellulose synthase catalytic subunit [UDP-forming] n=1 Tax=Alloyangia pacifica TaxID=311180 RepID=A0A2U8HLK2_9RHOB|nr:UDP-forming cellulose synthase catalytic subunit [Alloyangia pacifica]AWI85986.1 cellulose synthase catalytic subunit (UDP-forming) [Alloyangia pacifica]
MKSSSSAQSATSLLLFGVWTVLAVPLLFLASVPISVSTQGLLALVACVLIYGLKPFVGTRISVRFVVMSIAGVFVLRYWLWRAFETLPSLDDPVSLIAALVLFGAETFTVGLFFLTALITADPVTHPRPEPIRLSDVPTVDILVPSYDESPELLAVTLAAAKRVNYPEDRKTVVLCDDGGTDQRCTHSDPAISERALARRARLQALCDELGVVYTTRARNEHAKAGNLNAALRKVSGELVLILDADHVPTPDFLARTVGYFAERPRLFLVQTPHFFTNRDPIERNLALPENCPSENEMFYSEIHRGLDRLGGAFFCGSAALLRRKALDEVGGISGETITEDAETALDIHARGWESLYLDHAMIAGLQPETFASFIQQRGRWATGMLQMLILKNPIFRSGLTMAQRLCYLNSMSFWLFPLIRTIFLLSPLLYLFFGLEIFVVDPEEVFVYILPYLLIGFMVQNALFSEVRWPQISEVYEIAQTPYILKALVETVLRPRGASFKVTAKDGSLEHAFLSPIYRPLTLLVALLLAGLAAGAYRWYAFPGDRSVVQIVGAWALYNFVLAAYALRAVFERPRRLIRPRTAVSTPGQITLLAPTSEADREAQDVTILSASPEKFQLQLKDGTQEAWTAEHPGATVALVPTLPKAPDLETALPMTISEVRSGVEGTVIELSVAPEHMVQAAQLTAHVVYGDSRRWQFFRKFHSQSSTLVAGLLYVLAKSAISIPQSIFDFARELTLRSGRPEADDTLFEDAFTGATKGTQPNPVLVAETNVPQASIPQADGYLRIED